MQIFFFRRYSRYSVGTFLAFVLCVQTLFARDRQAPRDLMQPVFRIIPDTVSRAYLRNPDFEYANNPEYWRKEPVQPAQSNWLLRFAQWFIRNHLSYLFYLFFGVVILYILLRVWKENGFSLLQVVRKSRGRPEAQMTEEPVAIDLDAAIRQCIADRDWSAGVRFMYLKMISLAGNPTETAWKKMIRNHPQGSTFNDLHRAYEFVFYGRFGVSQEQFHVLEKKFNDAYKMIES
jgi:hypothetical protein